MEDELRSFIIDHIGWDGPMTALSPGASLIDGGVLDSLGLLELVQFLEERYGIDVHEEDLVAAHFDSIGAVASYVRSKSAAGPPPGFAEA